MLSQPTDDVWVLLVLELFEAAMQYAPTLGGVIERLYGYYRRSVFLFFAVHPAFAFVLFVIVKTGVLNWPMLFIVSFKIFDIFYKLEIIKARYIRGNVPPELAGMLQWKLPWWLFLVNAALYVPMLYFALSN